MEINHIEDSTRAEFLQAVADNAKYWAELPNKTDLERCNGVTFGIMVTLDGYGCDKPAKSFFVPGYLGVEGDEAEGMDLECAGCICLGHTGRELHAEYGKYKHRSEPGIGRAFMRLVAGLIRRIFGKR